MSCPCRFGFSVKPPKVQAKLHGNGGGANTRQVWRRKKLSRKDDMAEYRLEIVPFLGEQVQKIREGGKILSMDIERLMMSEENRFAFVNEVAAEATEYVENNRSKYGGAKKAVLHVLSNRLTDAGYERVDRCEQFKRVTDRTNFMMRHCMDHFCRIRRNYP